MPERHPTRADLSRSVRYGSPLRFDSDGRPIYPWDGAGNSYEADWDGAGNSYEADWDDGSGGEGEDELGERMRAADQGAGGPRPMERTEVLDRAREAVGGRDDTHGEPEDNFARIASMWTAYLGDREIAPHEVADMMVALKLCRIASGHPDTNHYTDIAGYATLGAMLVSRQDGATVPKEGD